MKRRLESILHEVTRTTRERLAQFAKECRRLLSILEDSKQVACARMGSVLGPVRAAFGVG